MRMREFILQRDEDVSGVSGTGMVAEGVEFSDNRVVIHWFGDFGTIVVHESIESVRSIHGHDGRTRIIWLDE